MYLLHQFDMIVPTEAYIIFFFFWHSVFQQKTDQLYELQQEENKNKKVKILNHLITSRETVNSDSM